jgi:hypothetical protein
MSSIPLSEEDWVFYIHPTGHMLYHREEIDGEVREFPVYTHAAVETWHFSETHSNTKNGGQYEVEEPSNDFWEGVGLIHDFLESDVQSQKKEMLQAVRELGQELPYHEAEALDRLFGTVRNLDEEPGDVRELEALFSEVRASSE